MKGDRGRGQNAKGTNPVKNYTAGCANYQKNNTTGCIIFIEKSLHTKLSKLLARQCYS